MRWWLALAVPAVWFGHRSIVAFLAIYGGLIGVAFIGSLFRHPYRRCRSCKGTGRQPGSMFFWSDRACTSCGGSPRHRRWGVQALSSDKPVWAERAAAKARERKARPR